MVDLGSVSYYLGMTVTRERINRILRLGQVDYLEQVLRTYDIWDCKPVATPMDSALVAAATDYQCKSEFRLQCQSAVGSLTRRNERSCWPSPTNLSPNRYSIC